MEQACAGGGSRGGIRGERGGRQPEHVDVPGLIFGGEGFQYFLLELGDRAGGEGGGDELEGWDELEGVKKREKKGKGNLSAGSWTAAQGR